MGSIVVKFNIRYGDDSMKDTPVPIPNTEVKLHYADGTRRETSRETRKLPNNLRLAFASLFYLHIYYLRSSPGPGRTEIQRG